MLTHWAIRFATLEPELTHKFIHFDLAGLKEPPLEEPKEGDGNVPWVSNHHDVPTTLRAVLVPAVRLKASASQLQVSQCRSDGVAVCK